MIKNIILKKNNTIDKILLFMFLGITSVLVFGAIELFDRIFIYKHFYFYTFKEKITFIYFFAGIVGLLGIIVAFFQGLVVIIIEAIKSFFYKLITLFKRKYSIEKFNKIFYRLISLIILITILFLINNNFSSQSEKKTLLPTITRVVENSNFYVKVKNSFLNYEFIRGIKDFIERGNQNIQVGVILILSITLSILIFFIFLANKFNKKFKIIDKFLLFKEKLSKVDLFLSYTLFAFFIFLLLFLYYCDAYYYTNLYRILHLLVGIFILVITQSVLYLLINKFIIKYKLNKKKLNKLFFSYLIVVFVLIFIISSMAAYNMKNHRSIKAWIFRHTSFERQALSIIQNIFDLDRDGYSCLFDGGDKNDFNPNINPLSIDLPGNGIDENSIGGDLQPKGYSLRLPNKDLNNYDISKNFERTDQNKNVLLIHIDGLRADRVGIINSKYFRNLTPEFDQFTEKCVVFRNAFAQGTSTHGTLLPMQAMSYNHSMEKEDMINLVQTCTKTGLSFKDFYHYFGGFLDDKGITDSLISYFRKLKPSKFFYWIYYGGPHYPNESHGYNFGNSCIDLYDEDVKNTDIQLVRFINYLENNNYLDNTMIIVYGDHGEELLDHGSRFHGVSLYNELSHVPLIIYLPDQPGLIINQGVELIDIFPTIFEYLEINTKYYNERDGISLMSFIKTGKSNKYHKYFITERDPQTRDEFREIAIIDKDLKMKMIYNYLNYTFELFDLWEDPLENNNLIDKNLIEAKKLKIKLDLFLNGYII